MKIFTKFIALLSWAIFIFVLIDLPAPQVNTYGIPLFDKVVHFFIFGIFVWLLFLFFSELNKLNFNRIIFLSFLLATAYSALTEYLQKFVHGRNPSLFDFFAGILGIMAGLFFVGYFTNKKPRLLLHICCIGCGAYIAEELKKNYDIILYFFNPNIFPKEEYERRLEETKKIANKFRLELIIGEYGYEKWLKIVKGLEKEPEGGKRCRACYQYRLKEAAKKAKENNCQIFATTLSISPHKDTRVINEVGSELVSKYGIKFLDKDFKKDDGFKKSCCLSKELRLYRQNYCGCEFSIRKVVSCKI